jgi:hypothetical protein
MPIYGLKYSMLGPDHENYQYALVSGPDESYFWILARQPEMPPNLNLGPTVIGTRHKEYCNNLAGYD